MKKVFAILACLVCLGCAEKQDYREFLLKNPTAKLYLNDRLVNKYVNAPMYSKMFVRIERDGKSYEAFSKCASG